MTYNIDSYINKAKKNILNRFKKSGYCENLGQAEIGKARDIIFMEQFDNMEQYKKDLKKVNAFSAWVDAL